MTTKNEFLLVGDCLAEISQLTHARPEAVVRWIDTVFWNHYRKELPVVAKAPNMQTLALDEDGQVITRRVQHPTGVRKTQVQLKDGTWVFRNFLRGKEAPPRKITAEEREARKYDGLHALRTPAVISSAIMPIEGVVNVLFKDLSADAIKALQNGAELVALEMRAPHRSIITHFIDFLSMYHDKYPDKDLSRISVPQCTTMVLEWDKELARQKELEALKAGTHELFTASNGCVVLLLHSVEAVEREGQRLGNCLKSSAKHYLNESGAVVIVRNPEGSTLAAAQLIVKLRAVNEKLVTAIEQRQFYGRSNTAVPEEAEVALQEAAKHLDWRNASDARTIWFPESSVRRVPSRRTRPERFDGVDADDDYELRENEEIDVDARCKVEAEEEEEEEGEEEDESAAENFDPESVYRPPAKKRRRVLRSPLERGVVGYRDENEF